MTKSKWIRNPHNNLCQIANPPQWGDKNAKYVDHGKILVLVFDPNSFNYLLNYFCKDSKANYKGTYDNYGFNPGNYSPDDSLLKDL